LVTRARSASFALSLRRAAPRKHRPSLTGDLQPVARRAGRSNQGSITFAGARIDRLDAADVVRRGLIQVMEGRHCFEHLTVEENLLTGAYTRRDGRAAIAAELDRGLRLFPAAAARRRAIAATPRAASSRWWRWGAR